MLLDADYSNVRDAIRKAFPGRDFKYMLDYLTLERVTHNSNHASKFEVFSIGLLVMLDAPAAAPASTASLS